MCGSMWTTCPSPWTQTYTLHHAIHTKTHTQTRREASAECACTSVYMRALGHKFSPGPSPAPELFWARPGANKVRDGQHPAGPSHCVTGLAGPVPHPHLTSPPPPPAQAKSKISRIPAWLCGWKDTQSQASASPELSLEPWHFWPQEGAVTVPPGHHQLTLPVASNPEAQETGLGPHRKSTGAKKKHTKDKQDSAGQPSCNHAWSGDTSRGAWLGTLRV